MERINAVLISLLITGLMTGCGAGKRNENQTNEVNVITMTAKTDRDISFYIADIGEAAIDWGDGSAIDSVMLSNKYSHMYPDTREYVITLTGDITQLICNGGGLIHLDVSNNTVLTELDCGYNRLTHLDVSNNTALTELICNFNQLTSLDVSKNTALARLDCYGNQLTSLDVSRNTALTWLFCYWNNLTNLNLRGNTTLTDLSCYGNPLTNLDISSCTALIRLECMDNQLTSLDLSHNMQLEVLDCYGNQLTNLDVSRNIKLTNLGCQNNQLESLDLSKNTELQDLFCLENRMSAAALDAMMTSLHNNDVKDKRFNLIENPGSDDCDLSIALHKRWQADVHNNYADETDTGIGEDDEDEDPMKARISTDIFSLPEMKFPHASIMFIGEPSDDRPYYVVQGGSIMPTQFVGSLWFHVYTTPKYEIKVYDVATDSEMSLDEWRNSTNE
jgi:hypothetical protein